MERFNVNVPDDLREKMNRDMKTTGIDNMSGFIRMALRQFPFRDGKAWSDLDMMNFVTYYNSLPPDPPHLLESKERRIQQALLNFKNKH